MPLNLLLVLALPAAPILLLPERLRWPWLMVFGIALLAVAVRVMVNAKARETGPDGRMTVREARRVGGVAAYAAALAIGAFASYSAIASVAAGVVLLGVAALWVVIWWPAVLRRVRYANAVMIRRDPAVVFAFFSDARNTPAWHSGYESVEKLTPGPVGPGTRFSGQISLPPSLVPKDISPPADTIEEIVDYEPNRRVTVRASMSGTSDTNREVITVEAVAGGSLVTSTFEMVLGYPAAVIGGALLGLRHDEAHRQRRTAEYARAKEVLEGGAEPIA